MFAHTIKKKSFPGRSATKFSAGDTITQGFMGFLILTLQAATVLAVRNPVWIMNRCKEMKVTLEVRDGLPKTWALPGECSKLCETYLHCYNDDGVCSECQAPWNKDQVTWIVQRNRAEHSGTLHEFGYKSSLKDGDWTYGVLHVHVKLDNSGTHTINLLHMGKNENKFDDNCRILLGYSGKEFPIKMRRNARSWKFQGSFRLGNAFTPGSTRIPLPNVQVTLSLDDLDWLVDAEVALRVRLQECPRDDISGFLTDVTNEVLEGDVNAKCDAILHPRSRCKCLLM